MSDIAVEAALPLSDLHDLFETKQQILTAFSRRMDREILSEDDPALSEESTKDRLFDVLMRRFDLMEAHRKALQSIVGDGFTDPGSLVRGLGIMNESMAWMLEAAHLDSGGLRGAVRVRGLTLLMAATIRVWLKDDTPDLSKTMAELDRRLAQADSLIRQSRSLFDRLKYRPETKQEARYDT